MLINILENFENVQNLAKMIIKPYKASGPASNGLYMNIQDLFKHEMYGIY